MTLSETREAGMQSADARVGEVVEAATSEFTAQCYALYDAPPLGSLVRCGEGAAALGIVCEASTQSLDPGRHALPRGEAEMREAGVFRSNPQLERLLYTRFRAIIVGYRGDDGAIRRYLPPDAPRLYSFVSRCDADELAEFSRPPLEFMPMLLAAQVIAQDDVIASFLRQASEAHPDRHGYLVSAGKSLATALAGQTHRLGDILRRLQ